VTELRIRRDDELEALLRATFESETRAQRDRIPSREFVLLMARIAEYNRRQSKLVTIQAWSEILVVGTIAALMTFWWNDATSGLEAIRPLAQTNVSGSALLGLAVGFFTVMLFWSQTWIRGR
jgi:hypothetical protein